MKVIGVTGGVGSGKSKVLEILNREYGALAIQADEVAKKLQEPGESGYLRLVETFGAAILDDSGAIDRPRLAEMIFNDTEKRRVVNAIIHPLTWEVIKAMAEQSVHPLVVVEAAILNEKANDFYDELWYVYSSEDVRIDRLSNSRGYTMDRILSMMASQSSDHEYRARADFIIDNDGTTDEIKKQIISRLGERQEMP